MLCAAVLLSLAACGGDQTAFADPTEVPVSEVPALTDAPTEAPAETPTVPPTEAPTEAPTDAPDIPEAAVFTEILNIGIGSAQDQLGIDMLVEGNVPEAFLVFDDGIAILDSVKRRVCVYEDGALARTIDLTQAHGSIYGYSMARVDERLFVLDTWTDTVFEFDYESGKIAGGYPVPEELVNNYGCDLFAENGTVYIGNASVGGKLFDLLDPDAEPVSRIEIDATWTTWTWSTPYTDGKHSIRKETSTFIYFIDNDPGGNAYFLVLYDIPGTEYICFEPVLMRCAPNGEVTGYAGLPVEQVIQTPHRHSCVLADGRFYEMICTETNVLIYEVTFGANYERRTDELREYFLGKNG